MLKSKKKSIHPGPLRRLKLLENALLRYVFERREYGMFHHVAHQEPNTATVSTICHPDTCDCGLLATLNQNLHLPKAHNHILLQHGAANCMLLTGASMVAHQRADNLNHNAGRVSRYYSLMRPNAIDHS